jgi:hypothetical protein
MQLAAFRFRIEGPFASVNSLRIGRWNSVDVPPHEIQNGLLLLCRFLVYQMRSLGIGSEFVRIGAKIHFAAEDGLHELRFPKNSKKYAEFNHALKQMMRHFKSVFDSCEKDNVPLENALDLHKSTIAGESFLYSQKDPGNFTRAMRKLVVNLKAIQAYETISGR